MGPCIRSFIKTLRNGAELILNMERMQAGQRTLAPAQNSPCVSQVFTDIYFYPWNFCPVRLPDARLKIVQSVLYKSGLTDANQGAGASNYR